MGHFLHAIAEGQAEYRNLIEPEFVTKTVMGTGISSFFLSNALTWAILGNPKSLLGTLILFALPIEIGMSSSLVPQALLKANRRGTKWLQAIKKNPRLQEVGSWSYYSDHSKVARKAKETLTQPHRRSEYPAHAITDFLENHPPLGYLFAKRIKGIAVEQIHVLTDLLYRRTVNEAGESIPEVTLLMRITDSPELPEKARDRKKFQSGLNALHPAKQTQ